MLRSKLLLRRMPNTRESILWQQGISAAAGNWSDKRDTGVTIGHGRSRTIQLPGGQPIAYGISAYNYTLDDGHYHANSLSRRWVCGDSRYRSWKDGSVSSVTVLKDGVSHSLTRE